MKINILKKNNKTLSKLYNEVFNAENEIIDIEKSKKNNIKFLCAIDDNEIVGAIMITTKFDYVQNIKTFYLDYVAVLEKYRRKGIATLMLQEVEKLEKKEKISFIEFTSNSKRLEAIKLYSSLNYNIKDTNVFFKKIV